MVFFSFMRLSAEQSIRNPVQRCLNGTLDMTEALNWDEVGLEGESLADTYITFSGLSGVSNIWLFLNDMFVK